MKYEEFLEHYGVKGQRWGVRRAQRHKQGSLEKKVNSKLRQNYKYRQKKKAAKIVKKDNKWEQKNKNMRTVLSLYNQAAGKANSDLPNINKKYEGKNLLTDMKAKAKYEQEVVDNFNNHFRESANQLVSPSGKKRYTGSFNPLTSDFSISVEDIQHGLMDEVEIIVTRDSEGLITNIEFGAPTLEQSALSYEEFLEHYGVKGQRWGVRRSKAALARNSKRELSADAKRARDLGKKKRSQLTNEELKFLNERKNLESNFDRLNPGVVSKGEQRTRAILGTLGLGVGAYNTIKSPAGQAAIKAGKAAIKRTALLPGGLPINIP